MWQSGARDTVNIATPIIVGQIIIAITVWPLMRVICSDEEKIIRLAGALWGREYLN